MESKRLIHRIFLSLWVLLLPFWDLGAGMALAGAFLASLMADPTAARAKWTQSAGYWPLWGILVMVGLGSAWHPISSEVALRYTPLALLFWAYDRSIVQRILPVGALGVMIYLLGAGLLRIIDGAPWDTLVYRGLLKGLHQHVYIGTYLLLAAVAAQGGPWTGRWKGLYWALTLLFLGLLGAKMLLISAGLAATWIAYQPRTIPRWSAPAAVILIVGFGVSQVLAQGRAMGHVFKPVDPYWATGSVDTRVVQAQAAWSLIQEKPWLGWGPGAAQKALDARYEVMNYRFGMQRHLNVHNQFLQWALTYGLVGLGIVWVFALAGFRAWTPPLTALGAFAFYFGSLWLTESFMERSLGLTLVALSWAWIVEISESD